MQSGRSTKFASWYLIIICFMNIRDAHQYQTRSRSKQNLFLSQPRSMCKYGKFRVRFAAVDCRNKTILKIKKLHHSKALETHLNITSLHPKPETHYDTMLLFRFVLFISVHANSHLVIININLFSFYNTN